MSSTEPMRLRHFVRRLLLAVSLTALVLAATPANAIENGRADGPRHHNVGLLGIDLDGSEGPMPPFTFCSGFVLSDSLFGTAAHCLAVFGPDAPWVVTLEPGSEDDPVYPPGWFSFSLFNFTDFPITADVEYANRGCMHPDYDPANDEHDLAVLSFDAGTFDVPPVMLPKGGWLGHLADAGSLANTPLELVGYGSEAQEERDGVISFFEPGHRKTALTGIAGLDASGLFYAPNDVWNGKTGIGDSGSPQFLTGRAVSVQTFALDRAQRLDTVSELSFLEALLAGDECPS